jgi:hypothetical protein
MSVTVVDNVAMVRGDTVSKSQSRGMKRRIASAAVSPWGWLAISCVIMGISGGFRYWRDRTFSSLAQESANCPFPLKELPKVLGGWRFVEGRENELDPEIVQSAGARDDVNRLYRNNATGEEAEVSVIYGLAKSVFAHTPNVCYPAAAWKPLSNRKPEVRDLKIPGSEAPAQFGVAFFSKKEAGTTHYVEVAYTFLHNNEWTPDVESRWKTFNAHPGMFKVLVQLQTLGSPTQNNMTESLIAEVVNEINKRVAEQRRGH